MKKPLLITTLAAGALLVGGTFAAYVITDNAAQKDVHIGIGNLIVDEDEPITLEWGEGTAIGDVEDLQPGAAKSVGKVVVKAVAEDTELVYDGRLDLQFEFEEGSKLDKYLTYHVYADNGGEIGEEIQAGNDGMFAVQGDAAGRTYHITVALGQPTDEDRIAISEDEATLYIDWKAAPAQEPAPQLLDTTFKVHAQTEMGYGVYVVGAFSEWKAIEAYRLEWGEGDIWSATIGLEAGEYEFKFVIEHWDEKDIPEKGEDYFAWIPAGDAANYVVVAGQTADYSGQQQQEDPGEDPEPAQYVVKVNGQAVNQAPEANPGNNRAVYKINVENGDKVAFEKGEDVLHFYHWDAVKEEDVDDGAEYTVTVDGIHTFYINSVDHVYVEEPAQQQAEAQKVEITLTDAPEWVTSDGAVLFVFTWEGEDQGFHLVDGEMKAEITNDITAFLVARCVKDTETPDWTILSGDAVGRIYNKTNNIAFESETTSYSVPNSVWVGYPAN